MKSRLLRSIQGIAVVTIVVAGMPARAEVVAFTADLKGVNEVPPNQSKAVGTVTASYDSAEKMLSWKGSYSGLSGQVTAAHFHGPAAIGRNAGIAIGITIGSTPGSFEGSANITEAQAADLMAGRWYVNLHTAANPAGEIRGQVLK